MVSYDVAMIRKHAQHCLRFMDAYRRDDRFIGPLLEFTIRKFSSHRRLSPQAVYEDIEREYKEYCAKKNPKK